MVTSLSNTGLQEKKNNFVQDFDMFAFHYHCTKVGGTMSDGQWKWILKFQRATKNVVSGNRVHRLVHHSRVCAEQSTVN